MGSSMFHSDVFNLYDSRLNALTHRGDAAAELRAKVLEFAGSDAVFGETGAALSGYWSNVHGGALSAWQEVFAKYLSGLNGLRGRLRSIDSDTEAVVHDEHVLDVYQLLSSVAATCKGVDAGLRAVASRVSDCGVDASGLHMGEAPELLESACGIAAETLEEFYRARDFTDANSDLAEVNRLLDAIERQLDTTAMAGPSGRVTFCPETFAASNPDLALSEAAIQAMFDRLMGLDDDEQEAVVARFMARGLDRLSEGELWALFNWLHSEDISHQQVADAILAARRLGMGTPIDAAGNMFYAHSPLTQNRSGQSLAILEAYFGAQFSAQARLNGGGDESRHLIHLLGREQIFLAANLFPLTSTLNLGHFWRRDENGELVSDLPRIVVDGNVNVQFSNVSSYTEGGTIADDLLDAGVTRDRLELARLESISSTRVFFDSLLESAGGFGISTARSATISRIADTAGMSPTALGGAVSAGLAVLNAAGAVGDHEERIRQQTQRVEDNNAAQALSRLGYGARFVIIDDRPPIIVGEVNRNTTAAEEVRENLRTQQNGCFADISETELEHAIQAHLNSNVAATPRQSAIYRAARGRQQTSDNPYTC